MVINRIYNDSHHVYIYICTHVYIIHIMLDILYMMNDLLDIFTVICRFV